jgi:hypothetical protein
MNYGDKAELGWSRIKRLSNRMVLISVNSALTEITEWTYLEIWN